MALQIVVLQVVSIVRNARSHAHQGSMPTAPHQRSLPVAVLLPVAMAPAAGTVVALVPVDLMLAVRSPVVWLLATMRRCSVVPIAKSMTVSAT